MTLRLAVLGDSIAHGIGATRRSDTLAARLEDALAETFIAADVRVFAVPGARSSDLAGQVRRAMTWQPDVAVVVIGANDLTQNVPPAVAAEQLRRAVRTLREHRGEVVVAPAPDLSVVPGIPAELRPVVRAASSRQRGAQVRAVLEEGGRIADAQGDTSAAFGTDESLFSADRFHPSSAGYALISEALVPVVVEAARAVSAQHADPESDIA
jgi:lysophospholipase L1-like esterase